MSTVGPPSSVRRGRKRHRILNWHRFSISHRTPRPSPCTGTSALLQVALREWAHATFFQCGVANDVTSLVAPLHWRRSQSRSVRALSRSWCLVEMEKQHFSQHGRDCRCPATCAPRASATALTFELCRASVADSDPSLPQEPRWEPWVGHGGATQEAVASARPLPTISTRGRWLSDRSVSRYGSSCVKIHSQTRPHGRRAIGSDPLGTMPNHTSTSSTCVFAQDVLDGWESWFGFDVVLPSIPCSWTRFLL